MEQGRWNRGRGPRGQGDKGAFAPSDFGRIRSKNLFYQNFYYYLLSKNLDFHKGPSQRREMTHHPTFHLTTYLLWSVPRPK